MAGWPVTASDPHPTYSRVPNARPFRPAQDASLRETRRRGDILFMEGSPATHVVTVVEGYVKLVKHSPSGKEVIVGIGGPGEVLGEISLLDRRPYDATAVVMTRAVVLRESSERVLREMARDPAMLRSLALLLSVRLRETQATVQRLATERVENRIATLLIKFAERHGVPGDVALRVPLTRQELADMVGATVETTIRTVSRFIQEGILERRGRRLVITDLDSLKAVANGEC
jgi:CRP/FNR family transcriptional regulator, cyclic AMP receptor protein